MTSGSRPLVARLMFIDEQIRTGKYPTRPALARELEVNPKTVGRNIEFLRDRLGAPVQFDFRKNGYYYSNPCFQFSLLQLTEGELVALFVAERILAGLRGTPFEQPLSQAVTRMTELLPGSVSINLKELSAVLSVTPTVIAEQDVSIYAVLSQAVLDRETLEIRYWTAGRNEESTRRVNPWHLTLLDGTWYLVAYCHTKSEPLMFALQRVRAARSTGEHFDIPEDFQISEYLGNSFRGVRGSGDGHLVRLRFHPQIAGRVREKAWHHTQQIQEHPDGSLDLLLTVSDLTDLKRWVLWWGADCEVLEPDELRISVKQTIQQLAELYGTESST